jgi:hypothetical protein
MAKKKDTPAQPFLNEKTKPMRIKSPPKLNPNSALDNCGIDLRLVINGLQKPLKRFVHRD